MVRDGDLRAIRVGRRVLVLKKPLMEMLEAEEDTSIEAEEDTSN